jgi:Uma2 family endonuclease
MAYTAQKILTFETFLDQYCDNFHYELADGELVDRSPTGPHETVSGKLATQIGIVLAAEKLPWFIPLRCCTILNKLFMNRQDACS